MRYLVTSDLTLDFSGTTTIYQKRWKVEEYHIVPFGYRSLKQNASLEKSPACTETTQTNHFVAAMWAWCKLELLAVQQAFNHYALKSQLYLSALKVAFSQLQLLNAAALAAQHQILTSIERTEQFKRWGLLHRDTIYTPGNGTLTVSELPFG